MPNTPVAIVLQKILKLPLFSEATHGMLAMVSAGDMVLVILANTATSVRAGM